MTKPSLMLCDMVGGVGGGICTGCDCGTIHNKTIAIIIAAVPPATAPRRIFLFNKFQTVFCWLKSYDPLL